MEAMRTFTGNTETEIWQQVAADMARPEEWFEYSAVLLQGGFLLAFDGIMFATHHAHGKTGLYPLLSKLEVGPGSVALVVKW